MMEVELSYEVSVNMHEVGEGLVVVKRFHPMKVTLNEK